MNTSQHFEQSIWVDTDNPDCVKIIDQRQLPHLEVVETLATVKDVAVAIKDMHVRGAPLIGVTAAFGVYFALLEVDTLDALKKHLDTSAKTLLNTRPTAVNLSWAVANQLEVIRNGKTLLGKRKLAFGNALKIMSDSISRCKAVGLHGLDIIRKTQQRKNGGRINILTHCNAGWLACIRHGTATAPVYAAHAAGIDVHVWVDETRPRNQGARLTAWELKQAGVPHTVITDNAGGHLMQHGLVDIAIVGCDRCTREGDVANKVGTYLKALAAKDNQVEFYIALPSSSVDWGIRDGLREIPIEERGGKEVSHIKGWDGEKITTVSLTPPGTAVANFAFDVTPAHLITGLITERGVCPAAEKSLLELYPEHA